MKQKYKLVSFGTSIDRYWAEEELNRLWSESWAFHSWVGDALHTAMFIWIGE